MEKWFVLNNTGKVHGNARKFNGYRHIAIVAVPIEKLMLRKLNGDHCTPIIIRSTKNQTVIAEETVYVGGTLRSYGCRKWLEYKKMAEEHNKGLGF